MESSEMLLSVREKDEINWMLKGSSEDIILFRFNLIDILACDQYPVKDFPVDHILSPSKELSSLKPKRLWADLLQISGLLMLECPVQNSHVDPYRYINVDLNPTTDKVPISMCIASQIRQNGILSDATVCDGTLDMGKVKWMPKGLPSGEDSDVLSDYGWNFMKSQLSISILIPYWTMWL
ncbi:hypothetical protein H920_18153 [Fukomys damarensis]|uniref:Uncharacterized protein n=1 Tax=Fukomys damarensis TaxID=885580 RepID=A0A091CRN3_FUKDA|nr:hypothetical protein H920_18153 [Fukomys damarensis]